MLFQGNSLWVELRDGGIAELCFAAEGQSVNKFDVRTVDELAAATKAIQERSGIRGVLVTSAKEAFIVGADIFEFTSLFARPPAEIEAHIAAQNAAFSGFDDLPVPTVAALNGLAFGGGLEMALACDGRVMSEATQIGLPEVGLGLFPGYGGTVRLPRLASARVAIDWISSGKPQSAQVALAAGVVEKVTAPDTVRTAALEVLNSLIGSGEWRERRHRRHGPSAADAAAFAEAREKLSKTAAHQPAALAAVDLMERAAGLTRDAALKLEHAAFAQIARTQAAASLIQLFINDQAIRKKAKEYGRIAHKVRKAAIVGAGIMGGGIAYTSASRGVPVIMKDIQQGQLDAGMAEASKLLNKQVESGRLKAEKATAVLADIHPTLEYSGFDAVDVVVEAVVEKMSVKKTVLDQIEGLVGTDTIIASNTSSLSISEMAGVLDRPEKFVGMHFFNPVPLMPLVEVIRGTQTSAQAAATVAGYANALGKTAIVVKECPGFLVNRILITYLLGFLRALDAGADFLEIDRVMESFGWPMGPAYLSDVVGMDTLAHVVEVISTGFADRMKVTFPNAVQMLVRENRLGQKNGSGFYRYETDPKGRPRKSVDPKTAELIAGLRSSARRAFSDDEMRERLMLPMIIEAVHCLEEDIVESPAEVDMSLILGLGFPRHVGGPLKYADWLGMKHVVERCDAYAELGPLYTPTDGMRAAAKSGGKFY
jgi:3-hydroxyacyl-CoA dehydrogenase/enoyl-CoA hydratase/3-hydroxybutyryl-CoA epimerase/enoyl-CoA isomerase